MSRSIACLSLVYGTLATTFVAADDFATDVQPILAAHCVDCHGADDPQGGVRLDRLDEYRVADQRLWTMIHENLRTGTMPPEDALQPTGAERTRVLGWIEARVRASRQAGETAVTRRLNRRELAAALQDVTGLSVDYAAALPGDARINGFDTGATALQDSADSVARSMTITRRAVDGVRFLDPPRTKTFHVDLRDEKDARRAFEPWKPDGATAKVRGTPLPGVGMMPETKWVGERGSWELYLPPPDRGQGVLRLQLVVAAYRAMPDLPNPHLWIEVAGRAVDFHQVTGTPAEPERLVYEVQLDDLPIGSKGVKVELTGRVELPYAVEGFENEDRTKQEDEIPANLYRPKFDKKALKPLEQPVPFVVLQEITIELDHVAAWPPAEWGADVGKVTDDVDSAKRLLRLWTDRAWRRPTTEAERARFVALYERLRADGMTFDDALRAGFQSVLMSGPFRELASPGDLDESIAQYAIASRLSFLLWGTPPDTELLALAAKGRLRDTRVLDEQVDRLIADPRVDGFVRPFVTQWLEMAQPITLVMDEFSQQDFRFGRYLKESMREETVAYVAELLREDRPARELVDSDWTMMNESLAIHYGYDGIEGGRLRRVKLRADDPRGGGLLGHAGIQSMLTWMGENWVIYRGSWTLRHILDDPPPPPPLEVPELIPSDGENRGKSFRELLVQHQEDAKCAVCHRDMDPLGFAFQNFDLSGRWRKLEYEKYVRNELDGKIEWRGAGKSRPVDATGRLPRGETFANFTEFKRQLTEHYTPDLVNGLTKNLVLYAVGREPDVLDLREIRGILQENAKRDYRLRQVLKGIVRSDAFLSK